MESRCFRTAAAVAAAATEVVQMIQGGKHGLTTNTLCADAIGKVSNGRCGLNG